MGEDPNQIRRDIESTRADMGATLDEIGDRVSPGRIVERRKERVRDRWQSVRTRVMGEPDDAYPSYPGAYTAGSSSTGGSTLTNIKEGASGAAGSVQGAAQSAAQTVAGAPQQAAQAARGNPLVAGAVAFGAGLLAAAALPSTKAEQNAASTLQEKAEPLTDQVKQVADEVKSNVADVAKDAASQLTDQAKQAADEVKSEAQSSAADLSDQAKSSVDDVKTSAQESAAVVKDDAQSSAQAVKDSAGS